MNAECVFILLRAGQDELSSRRLSYFVTRADPGAHSFLTIQALRAIAALSVVAYHANWGLAEVDPGFNPRTRALEGTAAGVDIFFVISGFVMMISLGPVLKSANPARTFFARRLQRIVPLYWSVTTFALIAYSFAPQYVRFYGSVWHALSSYLFIPAFGLPVIPPGWTLDYEMLFYVLFAVALFMKSPPIYFVSCFLVGMATIHYLFKPGVFAAITDGISLEFAFGMILALLVSKGYALSPRLSWLLLSAGLVLLASGAHAHYLARFIYWGIPALAVVAASVSLEPIAAGNIPNWLLKLGDASYSLYLVHMLVVWLVIHIWDNGHFHGKLSNVLFCVTYGILAIAAGLFVYWTVERPLIEYFKRRRKRAQNIQMEVSIRTISE